VDRQPIAKIAALLLATVADQRFAAMDIEVVHNEVNRLGEGVLLDEVPHNVQVPLDDEAFTTRCTRHNSRYSRSKVILHKGTRIASHLRSREWKRPQNVPCSPGACRYKSVESILKNSLDRLPSPPPLPPPSATPPHEKIRGSEYFD
jgi:hypothetical protein